MAEQSQATALIDEAERMYVETSNPYFVVMALAVADWGDVETPQWALGELLRAVHAAVFEHNAIGGEISIDAALGLRQTRGRRSIAGQGRRAEIEAAAFDLVKTIHSCFDVAIPDACELVYWAIDFDFARHMGDCLPPSAADKVIGLLHEPTLVKEKLRAGDYWTITHGDRLGYALDHLIERYHRFGSKRMNQKAKGGKQDLWFFSGLLLLKVPTRCARSVDRDLRGVSSIAPLPKRPAFARFMREHERAGSKHGASNQ